MIFPEKKGGLRHGGERGGRGKKKRGSARSPGENWEKGAIPEKGGVGQPFLEQVVIKELAKKKQKGGRKGGAPGNKGGKKVAKSTGEGGGGNGET